MLILVFQRVSQDSSPSEQPRASHLASLCLGFPVCEMGLGNTNN